MTKVNFAEGRKKAESEGLLGSGGYLKLQEGENRVRLMSECLEHPGEYKGMSYDEYTEGDEFERR